MKKFITLLLLAGCGISAVAQNKWSNEPYLTKSLSAAAIKDVFVRTSGGYITVKGVSAAEAKIEVFVTPGGDKDISKEELKQRLDEYYTLELTDSDHELHATAKSKQNNLNWKKSLSISFKIYVPQQVATNLTTSGGSIQLADLTGEQNFTTSGGSLSVTNVSGKIKGRTSGGSIKISGSKQDIDMVTSGGSITASNCEGNIRLTTSGGSLRLTQLKGVVNAMTSGGSIQGDNVSGELVTSTSGGSIELTDLSGSVEASTSAGSVHVSLKEVGKYVKLNTSAGHIDLQMPSQKGLNLELSGSRVNANLTAAFNGRKDDDRISGKLNGGGVPVEVHASNGRVSLKLD